MKEVNAQKSMNDTETIILSMKISHKQVLVENESAEAR